MTRVEEKTVDIHLAHSGPRMAPAIVGAVATAIADWRVGRGPVQR